MSRLHRYPGSCHCGNLEVQLHSDRAPAELGLRTDTCSFCARHQARYSSDPAGALHLGIRDPSLVQRYRFGSRTADFLICRECGVFVAACMPDDGLAVVNVLVLDARADFLASPLQIVDLERETTEERLARRRARWTPLVLIDRG